MKGINIIIILFIGLNLCTWIAPPKASALASIDFKISYDELSPYGYWVDNSDSGYIWEQKKEEQMIKRTPSQQKNIGKQNEKGQMKNPIIERPAGQQPQQQKDNKQPNKEQPIQRQPKSLPIEQQPSHQRQNNQPGKQLPSHSQPGDQPEIKQPLQDPNKKQPEEPQPSNWKKNNPPIKQQRPKQHGGENTGLPSDQQPDTTQNH